LHKPYRTLILGALLILATAIVPACSAPASQADDAHLKMGLLPILDVIPLYVADQNGYFKNQGIQVDFVMAKSAQERDALLQTGQIDGVVNDAVAVGLFDKETPKIKIVRTDRISYPNAPQFRILASPNSSIRSVAGLKGIPIGISQNTVIQYVTDRVLQAQGLAPADINVIEVTAIPVRFEQLMNGNLKAATLPDPMGQGAQAAGARLIADDSAFPQYSQSYLSFRVETLRDKPGTVRKFLVAWEEAVKELNADPGKYQDVLIQKGNVPQSIEGTFKMPPFPEKSLPTPAEMADVVQWMRAKGLIDRDIPYSDMVDPSYLPQ
jgi:NitT/TauT family transport system substrate-binding protein